MVHQRHAQRPANYRARPPRAPPTQAPEGQPHQRRGLAMTSSQWRRRPRGYWGRRRQRSAVAGATKRWMGPWRREQGSSPDAGGARSPQGHERGVPGAEQPVDGAAREAAPCVGNGPELVRLGRGLSKTQRARTHWHHESSRSAVPKVFSRVSLKPLHSDQSPTFQCFSRVSLNKAAESSSPYIPEPSRPTPPNAALQPDAA